MKKLKRIFLTLMSVALLISLLIYPQQVDATDGSEELNSFILNDTEFTYAGNAGENGGWGTDQNYDKLYQGDSHWSNLSIPPVGDSVYYEFSFTGTRVELYGNKEKGFGKVKVSIDGQTIGTFDGYNDTKIFQQKLWEIDGLTNTPHTLRATLTNQKNENSSGYNTLIDFAKVYAPINTSNTYTLEKGQKFTIPVSIDPSTMTWESKDPTVVTVKNGLLTAIKEGTTEVLMTDPNSGSVTSFNITVIQPLLEETGSDDTFYKETNINDTVTGTGNLQFNYHGNWGIDKNIDGLYEGNAHWSDVSQWDGQPRNHYYTFKFTGKKIAIYGSLQKKLGIYDVYIDDTYMGIIDAYGATEQKQHIYFNSPILDDKEHTLKVVMTGKQNPNSQGPSGFVDYVKVTQNVQRIYPEEISLEGNPKIWEQYCSITPEIQYDPENTNQKNITWKVDESMIRLNDDGSLTPIKSGMTQISAIAKGKNGVKVISEPYQISILAGNRLGKVDYIPTTRTVLPENYDNFVNCINKENTMTLWRNDSGNAAAAVSTKEEDVNATISVSNFTNEYGDMIKNSHVEANFQKYISTYTGNNWIPTNPRPFDPPAPPVGNRKGYPDAIYGPEMKIAKKSVQPIWIKANIPEGTAPGTYEGKIIVDFGNGEQTELNQELEVLEINLNNTTTKDKDDYYLNLWQYPYASADYYKVKPFSQEHLEITKNQMQPYMEAGGRTGTASIVEEPWYHQTYCDYPSMVKWSKNNGEWSFDYTDFDTWVNFLINDIKVSYIECYSIVPWENIIRYTEDGEAKEQHAAPGTTEWKDAWQPFLKDFSQHLDEKGWFDKIIIAMDERPMSQMTAALDLIENIKNKDNKTFKVGGAVGSYNKDVWDRLFTVTPHIGNINNNNIPIETIRRVADERRTEGKLTSIYTMIADYPGMFTMSDPAEAAWTIWFAQYCNTDGFLRWAYDAWSEDPLNDNAHPYFEAGDMFFIYPGDYNGVNTKPRTTPRFEMMSEAIKDVKKLRQISTYSPEAKQEVTALFNSVQSFYQKGAYSNGIGTAGFRTTSETNKQDLANEVQRLHNDTINLARKYESETVQSADYSAVTTAIKKAIDLDRTKYTSTSLALVDEAVAAVIYDLTAGHQNKVNAMANNIEQAIKALVKIDTGNVNKYILKLTLEEANKVSEEQLDKLVPIVVTKFKDALALANATMLDQNATQIQVEEAVKYLTTMMHYLEFAKGDKTCLTKLIKLIDELDSTKYIETTWEAMDTVLLQARAVLADENALEADVFNTQNNLFKAYLSLRLIPNKDLLNDLINQTSNLNSTNYTSETWAIFNKAYKTAKAVYADSNATDQEITTAINNLESAYQGLKKINIDLTINQVINSGDYTNITIVIISLLISGLPLILLKKRKSKA